MSELTPNPYATPSQPMNPSDEKLWATLIHVGGIFFNFLPALVGYLVLKDRGPFIRQHSAAALNFQLTMLIAYVVGSVLLIVVVGFFVIVAVAIMIVVFGILAALAANRGEAYVYPLTITFVS